MGSDHILVGPHKSNRLFGVRIEFRVTWCQGLVGMVRVKMRDGWGIMHCASKCPHKDGSTRVRVCVNACVWF